MTKDRRNYLRYPVRVPIRLRIGKDPVAIKTQSGDLSEGGLYFLWHTELPSGTPVQVTLPVESRLFELKGSVAYSAKEGATGLFRTGISFRGRVSAFRAKLAEEILRIQEFRERSSEKAGCSVSEEEAARKWIKQYAEKFSEIYQ